MSEAECRSYARTRRGEGKVYSSGRPLHRDLPAPPARACPASQTNQVKDERRTGLSRVGGRDSAQVTYLKRVSQPLMSRAGGIPEPQGGSVVAGMIWDPEISSPGLWVSFVMDWLCDMGKESFLNS